MFLRTTKGAKQSGFKVRKNRLLRRFAPPASPGKAGAGLAMTKSAFYRSPSKNLKITQTDNGWEKVHRPESGLTLGSATVIIPLPAKPPRWIFQFQWIPSHWRDLWPQIY